MICFSSFIAENIPYQRRRNGSLELTTQQPSAFAIGPSSQLTINGRRPPNRRKWQKQINPKKRTIGLTEARTQQQTFSPEFTVQQNVAAFRRVMQAQFDRIERERAGLLPAEPPARGDLFDASESLDPVVQIVLRNQYEDFGFPVYRVNYDDEGMWARWYEGFEELLEASLERASGGERIKDRLILYRVEDEQLHHMPFRAVQE